MREKEQRKECREREAFLPWERELDGRRRKREKEKREEKRVRDFQLGERRILVAMNSFMLHAGKEGSSGLCRSR